MVELQKEQKAGSFLARIGYRIDGDGNLEITSFKQIKESEIAQEAKPKKERLTIEQIAAGYPVLTLAKSFYRLNKTAAELIGVIDGEGKLTTSKLGNRIRLQVTYDVNENFVVTPILKRDDEENLTNSTQVQDRLTVSFGGQMNEMLAKFGKYFFVNKEVTGNGNKYFTLVGYKCLEDLLESVGEEIPEDADTRKKHVKENAEKDNDVPVQDAVPAEPEDAVPAEPEDAVPAEPEDAVPAEPEDAVPAGTETTPKDATMQDEDIDIDTEDPGKPKYGPGETPKNVNGVNSTGDEFIPEYGGDEENEEDFKEFEEMNNFDI